jgi:hypothetical protein
MQAAAIGGACAVAGVAWRHLSVAPDVRRVGKTGMTCAEVKPLLRAFIAAEVDDTTSRQIAQHLMSCPPCRALAEEMRSTPV